MFQACVVSNYVGKGMTEAGNFARKLDTSISPVGIFHFRQQNKLLEDEGGQRRERFDSLRPSISSAIEKMRSLTPQQSSNVHFLENEFIPALGLNDEMLHEQPRELSAYFGRGLHLWQYPKQLARYLLWLTERAPEIVCYMEIGCRWGGMFVLISEWLRKHGAHLRCVIAVDPIKPTPFISQYFNILQNENASKSEKIAAIYIEAFSTSAEVVRIVDTVKPDFVFIDGDHTLKGALWDHMLVRDHAQIVVHHESVNGSFLGIGVMKRKIDSSNLNFDRRANCRT
jgi:cephalosporin hydroxylase